MLNLGIAPDCDVSMRLYSFKCLIEFTIPPDESMRSALETLNAQGIDVLSERDRLFNIHAANHDITQVAERIAGLLEASGLKVKRLASKKSIEENNPTVTVQSFILA